MVDVLARLFLFIVSVAFIALGLLNGGVFALTGLSDNQQLIAAVGTGTVVSGVAAAILGRRR